MTTLLIIEDNERLRGMMVAYLSRAGYEVLEAGDGLDALEALGHAHVDLIITDAMMPRMDGFAFVREFRSINADTPILMVTVKSELADKRQGFGFGVDDYIVKPVNMEELHLRVKALLRRAKIVSARFLTVGGTTLREDSLTVSWGDTILVLPQKEFMLLQKLLSYAGKIFTRQDLMDGIWGYDSESDPRTVDVHISRLRERLFNNNDFEIETIRGLGYKAVKENEVKK